MHLANDVRPLTVVELEYVVLLQPKLITFLIHDPEVVPEYPAQIGMLSQQLPNCLFVGRSYIERAILMDPAEAVNRIARQVAPYLFLGPRLVVQTLNEPNHPVEGGVTDPLYISSWCYVVQSVMEQMIPGIQVAIPPLWPDDQGKYRAIYTEIARYGKLWSPYICVHAYERAGNWEDIRWLSELFGSTPLVTEWDSWTPTGYASYQECLAKIGDVRHSWFLLDSDTPEFQQFSWLKNEKAILKEVSMPEFIFGNKTLAEKLGANIVGEPVEDDDYFPTGNHSLQVTTKGFILYSKKGNISQFHAAALPKA